MYLHSQNLSSKVLGKGDNTAIHTANPDEPFKLNLQVRKWHEK